MAKDLTARLAELTEAAAGSTSRQDKALPAGKPTSEIPSRSGTGKPGSSGTGSIASPLTEQAYATRTFWPEKAITSTDGIFVIKVKPIKQMSFQDANLAAVVMNFSEPV